MNPIVLMCLNLTFVGVSVFGIKQALYLLDMGARSAKPLLYANGFFLALNLTFAVFNLALALA